MPQPVLLWICVERGSSASGIGADLSVIGRVHCCSTQDDIPLMVGEIRPDALCFDFDNPTRQDLAVVCDTKRRYPSLPILMFSEELTAELAIWALRARVWDCFTKPVVIEEVRTRLDLLAHIAELQRARRSREVFMPTTPSSDVANAASPIDQQAPTLAAVHYATGHFHERIPLTTVARLCRMGTYEFSRRFRREQGVTFRKFMNQLRVHEAAKMLQSSRSTVLEVACAVGFSDPSHFARMFRRHFGVTPSTFRARSRRRNGSSGIDDAQATASLPAPIGRI